MVSVSVKLASKISSAMKCHLKYSFFILFVAHHSLFFHSSLHSLCLVYPSRTKLNSKILFLIPLNNSNFSRSTASFKKMLPECFTIRPATCIIFQRNVAIVCFNHNSGQDNRLNPIKRLYAITPIRRHCRPDNILYSFPSASSPYILCKNPSAQMQALYCLL